MYPSTIYLSYPSIHPHTHTYPSVCLPSYPTMYPSTHPSIRWHENVIYMLFLINKKPSSFKTHLSKMTSSPLHMWSASVPVPDYLWRVLLHDSLRTRTGQASSCPLCVGQSVRTWLFVCSVEAGEALFLLLFLIIQNHRDPLHTLNAAAALRHQLDLHSAQTHHACTVINHPSCNNYMFMLSKSAWGGRQLANMVFLKVLD